MDKIKLVMVDVDFTLLDAKKQCSQENIAAITRLNQKQIKFGIASGRTLFNLKRVLPTWQLNDKVDFLIGSNGAEIFDMRQNQLYQNCFLKKEVIWDIYATIIASKLDVSICVYEDDYLATNHLTTEYLQRTQATALKQKVINYQEYVTKALAKVIVVANPLVIDKLIAYLDTLEIKDYRYFKSQPMMLEVTNPSLSKSYGVKLAGELLGLEANEIMTIGDNDNDIEMVRDFQGVAMANATNKVKEVATYHTTSCEESGVAHIINKLIL